MPAVPLPPEFLRACARYAGCHIWGERNAVVYAATDMVALHTGGAGSYELLLPRPAVVTDLIGNERTSRAVARITIDAPGPVTRIFRLE